MARRRHAKKTHHARKKLPLLATAGVAASAAKVTMTGSKYDSRSVVQLVKAGNLQGAVNMLQYQLKDVSTYTPIVAGAIGSFVAGKVGINRYMPSFVRL